MKHLITLVWLLSVSALGAQSSSPPSIKEKISYTLEEVSYYKIPSDVSPELLSPFDLLLTKRNTSRTDVQKTVYDNGHYFTEVVYLNPEEVFSEWPEQIVKMVMDSAGIRSYFSNDSLASELLADSAYSAQYNFLKSELVLNSMYTQTEIAMPDSQIIVALQALGITVEYLTNGALRLHDVNQETIYDPQNLRISMTRYESEKPVERHLKEYTMSEENTLIPSIVRREYRTTRPSGICMNEVVVQTYSNFSIERFPIERGLVTESTNQKKLKLWPNPATESILMSMSGPIGTYDVSIYNALGILMYTQKTVAKNTNLQVPIANWPSGLYRVQCGDGTTNQTITFLKKS